MHGLIRSYARIKLCTGDAYHRAYCHICHPSPTSAGVTSPSYTVIVPRHQALAFGGVISHWPSRLLSLTRLFYFVYSAKLSLLYVLSYSHATAHCPRSDTAESADRGGHLSPGYWNTYNILSMDWWDTITFRQVKKSYRPFRKCAMTDYSPCRALLTDPDSPQELSGI